jgi:hypothetical protein
MKAIFVALWTAETMHILAAWPHLTSINEGTKRFKTGVDVKL